MLRLLSVYEDEIVSVYPIFDIQALISQTQRNYDSWMTSQEIKIDPATLDLSLLRVAIATASEIESMKEPHLNRQLIIDAETDVFKTYASSTITCREAVIFTAMVKTAFFPALNCPKLTIAEHLLLPHRSRAHSLAENR